MEVVRKKMLIKYWDDMYSIGHMALFLFSKLFTVYKTLFLFTKHFLSKERTCAKTFFCKQKPLLKIYVSLIKLSLRKKVCVKTCVIGWL